MPYHPARLNLSRQQLLNAVKEKPIRIKHSQINTGSHVILLHPANHAKILKAYNRKKGTTFILAPGEIHATQQSELEGTGVFDFLKKAYNWVKGHWSTIKPILSGVLDLAAPAAAAAFPEGAAPILAGRKLLKDTTGVGLKKRCASKGDGLYVKSGNGLYL